MMTHSYNGNGGLSGPERKRRIEAIRKQIEIGAYRVNKAALAEALLRSMQQPAVTTSRVRRQAAA